jgi:hypothetical protein
MTSEVSFVAFVVASYTAALGWASGLTKLAYNNKGRIAVLEERTVNTDARLEKMDGKLDRLVEHLLGKEE